MSPEPILRPRPFVWYSDGVSPWQRSSLESPRTARWWIDRVVAGGGTLLLIASAVDGDRGWMWTSSDGGASFELVEDLAFRPDRAAVAHVTSGFVAVSADGESAATVWLSTDGRSWEASEAPFPAGWRIAAAVAVGDTLVALGGTAGAPRPDSVWRYDGGRAWHDVTDGLIGAGGPAEFAGAAAGPAGLAVYGTAGGPALWLSADGARWQRVTGDQIDGRAAGRSGVGAWVPSAVALGSDRIVLVGRRSGGRSDVVWVGEISVA